MIYKSYPHALKFNMIIKYVMKIDTHLKIELRRCKLRHIIIEKVFEDIEERICLKN